MIAFFVHSTVTTIAHSSIHPSIPYLNGDEYEDIITENVVLYCMNILWIVVSDKCYLDIVVIIFKKERGKLR